MFHLKVKPNPPPRIGRVTPGHAVESSAIVTQPGIDIACKKHPPIRPSGSDWTQQEVEDAVGVAPRGESNLVAVTAQSEDPDEAAEVANRYANAALQFRRRSIEPALEREIRAVEAEAGGDTGLQRLRDAKENGDQTLSISSPARAPSSSSLPSPPLVLLAALIVGILVGVAGVMIADVARTTPEAPQPTA